MNYQTKTPYQCPHGKLIQFMHDCPDCAAAEIERLTALCAWTPIGNALPDLSELAIKRVEVLCRFDYGGKNTAIQFKVITFSKRHDQDAAFETNNSEYITHWKAIQEST